MSRWYPALLASWTLCMSLALGCAGAESRPAPSATAHNAAPTVPKQPASAPTPVTEAPSIDTHTHTQQAPAPAQAVVPERAAGVTNDKAAATKARLREVHPQPDQTDCVEMYGSCTPLPDRVCTSQAFVLECGKSAQPPGSRELLKCVCP